ncbi:hypothetical protein PoB_003814900 [Plakobranchus ocellatus]|uniref:Uncharacterized protein n=1 Tax=Plakobranchus ocellatus TaxID=259542 RepID=A0AAV4AV23_9GAST|nr:hypothetical protein PoB_003814900 [Plakobranchus ocellatus]
MPQKLQGRVITAAAAAATGRRAGRHETTAAAPHERLARGLCGRVGRAHHQPRSDAPLDAAQEIANVALQEFPKLHARSLLGLERSGPQQGDLGLSGPPSGQGAGGDARIRDKGTKSEHREKKEKTMYKQ